MAQIVTITNPLTGQPAQVDQLDHTAQEIDDGIGFESTDYPGCYYRLVNGVMEWLNPPMVLGTEYRTTERIGGSPVYKKLAKLGSMPSNTTEDFPFTDDKNARCFEVCAQVGYFVYAGGWRFTLPSGKYLAPVGIDNKIRITSTTEVDNSVVDHPVTAIVKYIKV